MFVVNYAVTTVMIFIVANLLAFITHRRDKSFRWIVFGLSIIGAPIVAYFMVT